MINYRITSSKNFEEVHKEYFEKLLNLVQQAGVLSSNIDEIIITDQITDLINQYSTNKNLEITRDREYTAIGKIVDFKGKKKVLFDARFVNVYNKLTPQVFIELLIEVHAEDIIEEKYTSASTFYPSDSLIDVIKAFFLQWATKTLTHRLTSNLSIQHEPVHTDVKIYADAFKRKIRKLHYQYQKEVDIGRFWIEIIMEVDSFIRRCLDVRSDDGDFTNLQEFDATVPSLLEDISNATDNLLNDEDINFSTIKQHIIDILKVCYVELLDDEKINIQITDTPKKLFKNSLVDTEPRIVAFLDILGFTSIIEEYDSDEYSNILNELHDTLELAIKVSIDSMIDPEKKTDLSEYLEYRMFSDCICLSLPYIEFGNDFHIQFHSIATIVKAYQSLMMHKGFFIRGGISIGSFYADSNMIFSGALVNAYKLEKKATNPIIAVDKPVLNRLKHNFTENSIGLFLDKSFLYSESDPEIVFVNPFDLIDNSTNYLDSVLSTLDELAVTDEEEDDPLNKLTNQFINLTKSFTKPIYEDLKSKMNPDEIVESKEMVLNVINDHLFKHSRELEATDPDSRSHEVITRIISKYEFMKSLTEWSLGTNDSSLFNYYSFTD